MFKAKEAKKQEAPPPESRSISGPAAAGIALGAALLGLAVLRKASRKSAGAPDKQAPTRPVVPALALPPKPAPSKAAPAPAPAPAIDVPAAVPSAEQLPAVKAAPPTNPPGTESEAAGTMDSPAVSSVTESVKDSLASVSDLAPAAPESALDSVPTLRTNSIKRMGTKMREQLKKVSTPSARRSTSSGV